MTTIKFARFKFPSTLLSPNDEVLDLGCGNGLSSYFYSTVAKKVVGLDLHPDLEWAKEHLRKDNLSFIKGDILDPPESIYQSAFDIVVSVDVIEHISRLDGEMVISFYRDRLTERGMMIVNQR